MESMRISQPTVLIRRVAGKCCFRSNAARYLPDKPPLSPRSVAKQGTFTQRPRLIALLRTLFADFGQKTAKIPCFYPITRKFAVSERWTRPPSHAQREGFDPLTTPSFPPRRTGAANPAVATGGGRRP